MLILNRNSFTCSPDVFDKILAEEDGRFKVVSSANNVSFVIEHKDSGMEYAGVYNRGETVILKRVS